MFSSFKETSTSLVSDHQTWIKKEWHTQSRRGMGVGVKDKNYKDQNEEWSENPKEKKKKQRVRMQTVKNI